MLGWSQTQKGSKERLFIMTQTHNMQILWEIPLTLGWSVKLLRGGEVILKVVTGTNNKLFYDCKSPLNLTRGLFKRDIWDLRLFYANPQFHFHSFAVPFLQVYYARQ